MYLKSIEMQGFKSFADKTKVVFERGVTAVVGPNGSGKSNITESLRWALGESSAKSLRGGKMPDIIFAGTETRKPLNYASVAVTLDNSNGFIKGREKEIRVERQIYRSGESEYLIDNQKVRLRDVHDLFMDTGLGRDSFSIISQGRVEEIFNSKPEERRAIFEEAAGVLKYKTRKKETESKLAQTQDNLDRLEDIIYELENQVKPLEKQAQTAKQFLILDKERQDLYLDVLVNKLQTGRKQLTEEEMTLERVKEELTSYYQQRESLEQENQVLKKKRHHLQDTIEKEQAKMLDLTRLCGDMERKIEIYKLESSQQESSQQDARERLVILQEKHVQVVQDLDDKMHHIQRLEQDLESLKIEIAQIEEEISQFSEDPDTVIEHYREQYVQLLQEEAEVSNQLAKTNQDIENHVRMAKSRTEEFEQLEKDKVQSEKDYRSSKQLLEQAEKTLKVLGASYQEHHQEYQELETLYQSQQTVLFDLFDEMKTKEARKSSLEAILKNHSNFYAGVKAVLQAKGHLRGVIGAVSEHLTFDTAYQTAIEIALGAASQHIIVEDETAAKAAIQFLKQHRSGRATFLPMTTIRERSLPSQYKAQLRQAPGFLGTAADLVRYDDRLSMIFNNLLGAVAIFDTLDHASAAAKVSRFQVRIVTLDGSEIRAGGAFAGGSQRNQTSIFIKPELEELETVIVELKKKIAEQESKVSDFKSRQTNLRENLEQIKSQGETARLEEQKLRLTHQQVTERKQDLQRLYDLQIRQNKETALPELEQQQVVLKEQLTVFDSKKQDLTKRIEEVKTNRYALQEQLQVRQEKKSDLLVKNSQLASEIGFEKTDSKRLVAEKENLESEILLVKDRLDQTNQILDDTSLDKLVEQLEVANQEKNKSQQALVRLKFELEDIEGRFEDLEEQLEKARLKNDDLIRSQAKLESECEQLSQQLRQLVGIVTEQYKMSVDEATARAKELENLAQAEQKVRNLERDIRKLGPINTDAIDQYEEVHQRLVFLNGQRSDVLSARDLLLQVISEMDDEVKDRFKQTFDAIRTSFQMTFKQIFGGGRADLLLTTPDLLTAGVEISVQPPGKKIQSLNLMSGGEKALSALALLFSIIRVKTIPFVILDEVEAALDEANVKRFGDYLNRFDKDSQFIVVTHRKGTMAAADAIYGVTMQESGVSRIVSVKLKDVEELDSGA